MDKARTHELVAVAVNVAAMVMLGGALMRIDLPYAFFSWLRAVVLLGTVTGSVCLILRDSRWFWVCVVPWVVAAVHLTERMGRERWEPWNLAGLLFAGMMAYALAKRS